MPANQDSAEMRARWRREEIERCTGAMVSDCRTVKRALRAAGVRAWVGPAPRHTPGDVVVRFLDD